MLQNGGKDTHKGLLSMCLDSGEGRGEFWTLFCLGQNDILGGRFALGELGAEGRIGGIDMKSGSQLSSTKKI